MNKKTILVTGGAGFIGSNFIKLALATERYKIVNLDALTYAGNLENLRIEEQHPDYTFWKGRIQDKTLVADLCSEFSFDGIINFAAESHVDRSIDSAAPFVDTNIGGTLNLLECAKNAKVPRFLQVSTDEVYGSLGPVGKFSESTPIDPKSPYSASKASSDHLVSAFVNTYGFPALITRCSNNYGAYQFPEKLIPLVILNALDGKSIPVYGDGLNVRDWIFVLDHCSAILDVFEKGKLGSVYNVGADEEKTNIEIIKRILSELGKSENLITYVKDRPGHDRRYAMDSSKIQTELGWMPKVDFNKGIKQTIDWYLENPEWCSNVRNGSYMEYYHKQYGE